jgi:RNA polymerase sigma factor (sigma-70 family)
VTGKDPFEAIVARHGATVWRVCRAVVGPEDADDAWSETFLAALRAYPDLPADANVQAWLVTIAHRKAIDLARAASRRAVPLDTLPDAATVAAADGPDDALVQALAALPLRQQRAVLYHHVAGLPYAEVATLLGGSVVAARRSAADGMATLRRTYPGALAGKGATP